MLNRSPVRVVALVLSLLLMLGHAGSISSGSLASPKEQTEPACGVSTGLLTFPAAPDLDAVWIVAYGVAPDRCHVPEYRYPHFRRESTIVLDAVIYNSDRACIPVLTDWRFSTKVEALPPGSYTALLYITDIAPTLCASSSFTVPGQAHWVSLPLVVAP